MALSVSLNEKQFEITSAMAEPLQEVLVVREVVAVVKGVEMVEIQVKVTADHKQSNLGCLFVAELSAGRHGVSTKGDSSPNELAS